MHRVIRLRALVTISSTNQGFNGQSVELAALLPELEAVAMCRTWSAACVRLPGYYPANAANQLHMLYVASLRS